MDAGMWCGGQVYRWMLVARLNRPLSVRRCDPAEQASRICHCAVG